MPTPRLIAIDIDGTLLRSDGTVSPRTLTALHDAHAAGIETVIATGRRHAYAMRVLRQLGLHEDHAVISSNGAVIRTIHAELIHRSHLAPFAARWLCAHAGSFRDSLVFTFDTVGPDGDDRRGALVCETSSALYNNIDAWMQANQPYIANVDRIEDALGPEDDTAGPIQAMLCGTVARMAEAEQLLSAHPAVAGVGQPEFPGCELVLHRTAYPERDLAILDILPPGCSKASALDFLAQRRGCTLADTLAIGDNWNDLPMLEAAGRAILMRNAPEDLHTLARQRGWPIGPSNDEDGVAQALEAVLEEETVPVLTR